MAGTTENYGLAIWGKEDEFKAPEGLNGNFEAVDEVLGELAAGLCTFVRGSYTGDGTYNSREIKLGFQPSAVILCLQDGTTTTNEYIYGGLFFPDSPLRNEAQYNYLAAGITEQGFSVNYNDSHRLCTNISGQIYYYLALKW